jgi:hypothetical protein
MMEIGSGKDGEEDGGGVYTIAVVGGGGVGKSSLIRRFIERVGNNKRNDEAEEAIVKTDEGEGDEYEPTLRDEYTIRIHLSAQRSCTPLPSPFAFAFAFAFALPPPPLRGTQQPCPFPPSHECRVAWFVSGRECTKAW